MNLFIILSILLLQWSIDLKDPEAQHAAVMIYGCIHTILVGLLLLVAVLIFRRNDKRIVKYTEQLTGDVRAMTVFRYDLGTLLELIFFKIVMQGCVSYYMARRNGLYFPFLVQCWSNPNQIWSTELVQLYLFEKEEVGNLERPWKQSNTLPQWMVDAWSKTVAVQKSLEENDKTSLQPKKRESKKKA